MTTDLIKRLTEAGEREELAKWMDSHAKSWGGKVGKSYATIATLLRQSAAAPVVTEATIMDVMLRHLTVRHGHQIWGKEEAAKEIAALSAQGVGVTGETVDELKAELAQCRAEKNALVLKAYPIMDAFDRVRAIVESGEFMNSTFTRHKLEDAMLIRNPAPNAAAGNPGNYRIVTAGEHEAAIQQSGRGVAEGLAVPHDGLLVTVQVQRDGQCITHTKTSLSMHDALRAFLKARDALDAEIEAAKNCPAHAAPEPR